MAERGTLLRVLELIEAHGGVKVDHGHIWIGNAAVGTADQWDEIKAMAAQERLDAES